MADLDYVGIEAELGGRWLNPLKIDAGAHVTPSSSTTDPKGE